MTEVFKFDIGEDKACLKRVLALLDPEALYLGHSSSGEEASRARYYRVPGRSAGAASNLSAREVNIDWLRSGKYPAARALKFDIGDDPEASRLIQEALFEMGAQWGSLALSAVSKESLLGHSFLYVSAGGRITGGGPLSISNNGASGRCYARSTAHPVDLSWIVKAKPAESRWSRPEAPPAVAPARRVGDWVFSGKHTPNGKPLYYKKTRS